MAKNKEMKEFQFYVVGYRQKSRLWGNRYWFGNENQWSLILGVGFVFDSEEDAQILAVQDDLFFEYRVFPTTGFSVPFPPNQNNPWCVGALANLVDEKSSARVSLGQRLQKTFTCEGNTLNFYLTTPKIVVL